MNDTITREKIFNHSIETVWNAITNSQELSIWFVKADFKAQAGYQYTFNSLKDDCSTIVGEVKSANPYVLIYTWIVKDVPEAVTTVTWMLEETHDGTKLSLEHTGISNYAGDTAINMFEGFSVGWDNCITELAGYLKQEVNAG